MYITQRFSIAFTIFLNKISLYKQINGPNKHVQLNLLASIKRHKKNENQIEHIE